MNPVIVTRAQCGLQRPTPGMAPRWVGSLVGTVFHHAGVSYGDRDTYGVWREIQRYHMHPHGTEPAHLDIDYNAGVDRDGRVFLGRDAAVRGAHCGAPGFNLSWLGVVLIGNGDDPDDVTDAAWQSMLWCWQLGAYVAGFAGGPATAGLVTHGETMATRCAGLEVARRIDGLRRFLAGLAGDGEHSP